MARERKIQLGLRMRPSLVAEIDAAKGGQDRTAWIEDACRLRLGRVVEARRAPSEPGGPGGEPPAASRRPARDLETETMIDRRPSPSAAVKRNVKPIPKGAK